MFVELYKSNKGNSNIEKEAFTYLVDDTLSTPLYGVKKLKQLTGMDMESDINGFVSSMFYTFMYKTELYDSAGNYKYKDVVPLILCTSFDNDYVYGLNFNFLPGGYRAVVLDFIYDSFKSFYTTNLSTAVSKETYIVNEGLAKILYNENYRQEFFILVKSKTGIDLASIHRRYIIQNIQNLRMIEYDVWKFIPFLNFGESIRGANLAEVQNKIISNK